MVKIVTYGEIVNGKLSIYEKQKFIEKISHEKDCNIKLTIEKNYKNRSNQQNAYYWGVVVEITKQNLIECWGRNITIDQTHEILKQECNFEEMVINDKVIKLVNSTKKLNTTDFESYLERCRIFNVEFFNCVIPLPNEKLELYG